jgi:hypothetical protein
MTRAEHLDWCKQRAMEYAQRGDFKNAIASMISDLGKHPETQKHLGSLLGVALLMQGSLTDERSVTQWIQGFN